MKDSHSEPKGAQPLPEQDSKPRATPAKKRAPRKAAKKKTARTPASTTRKATRTRPQSRAAPEAPAPPAEAGGPAEDLPTIAGNPLPARDNREGSAPADTAAESPAAAGPARSEQGHARHESAPDLRADTGSPAHPAPHPRRHDSGHPHSRRERDFRRGGDSDRGGNGDRESSGESSGRDRFPRKPQTLGPPSEARGYVELSLKGFGFLRQADRTFLHSNRDTFIPPDLVRTFGLRDGMVLDCEVRHGVRGPQITAIHRINDRDPKEFRNLPLFEELTAINPIKRIVLETRPDRYTTRVIDMMTPIGRGQRGLIVAPPRTGKTTLLQHMAEAVAENYPAMKVILLLVDERPEEVTELSRALPQAEIFASSNDSEVRSHIRIAQLAIERAKRLVEAGDDVFILLDSITRLARAFNNATRGKGRTGSGGLEIRALEGPRKLFAAARNTREAGSLTIVATALIQTNSRADEVIFQEFKGTGNMELVLDRQIAQQYIFPAIDIFKSGTRREELLLPPHQREKIYLIRRGLAGHKPIEAIERLLSFLRKFPNNAQMLMEIKPAAVEV